MAQQAGTETKDQQVSESLATLKAQGIGIAVDPAESHGDIYVATAPNGEKYRFNTTGLLNLKAKERLHLEGLQEVHLAQKKTPNL